MKWFFLQTIKQTLQIVTLYNINSVLDLNYLSGASLNYALSYRPVISLNQNQAN